MEHHLTLMAANGHTKSDQKIYEHEFGGPNRGFHQFLPELCQISTKSCTLHLTNRRHIG